MPEYHPDFARQFINANLAPAADVHCFPHSDVGHPRRKDAPRAVAHVGEVASLRTIPKDQHRHCRHTAQEKLWNYFPAIAFVMTTRAVAIERPDDHGGKSI